MKKLFVLAAMLLACGGAKPVPGGGGEQAPQWLRQGSGMVNGEEGKRIQGVGAVSGMRDEIRGLNERIDKFIIGVFNRDP